MRRLLLTLALLATAAPAAAADIVTDWNDVCFDMSCRDRHIPDARANPDWSSRSIGHGQYDDLRRCPTRLTGRTSRSCGYTWRTPNTSIEAAVHQAAYDGPVQLPIPVKRACLTPITTRAMALIPNGINKTNGINLGQHDCGGVHDKAHRRQFGRYYAVHARNRTGTMAPDPFNPGQSAWGPGWGTVHTFGIPNTATFINAIPAIPNLNSQGYTDAFNMVKDYGALNSTGRTPEQKAIGLFWAYDRPSMGPPPVLFAKNLEEIAAQTGNTPAQKRAFVRHGVGSSSRCRHGFVGR